MGKKEIATELHISLIRMGLLLISLQTNVGMTKSISLFARFDDSQKRNIITMPSK